MCNVPYFIQISRTRRAGTALLPLTVEVILQGFSTTETGLQIGIGIRFLTYSTTRKQAPPYGESDEKHVARWIRVGNPDIVISTFSTNVTHKKRKEKKRKPSLTRDRT